MGGADWNIRIYEDAVHGLAYESLPEVPDSVAFADLTSQAPEVAELPSPKGEGFKLRLEAGLVDTPVDGLDDLEVVVG